LLKQIKIHRISIDSLALFVLASGCLVENLFVDLEIGAPFFGGGNFSERAPRDPWSLITVKPRALDAESGEALGVEYPLE
jgi:hypothetical protein